MTVREVSAARRIAGRCACTCAWRRMGWLVTLLLAAGLEVVAVADGNAETGPYLGRWDVTLHTPARDYSSWLDIQENGGRLRVRMVGRWGHARWLPQAAIANGRIGFVSPGSDEGRADDMVFEGERLGDELVGTTSGPAGEAWTWRAERAPALRRAQIPRRGDPIRLFNGTDIAGWTMANGAARPWRVADGTLRSSGGGADLQSLAKYDDFSLHIEFNCSRGANSGVYLRGRYEVQIEDDAEPEGPSERTGGIYGFVGPVVPAPRTPGVWHAYDITLIGRRVTVILDGTTLIDAAEIPGITGGALDSHEGLPGPILLQGSELGEVAYRNIVLTPLLAAEPAADVPTARVQRLLAAMSREDKMSVIRGEHEPAGAAQGEAGWTRGVPRLGIPDLRFADGPPGVLVHHVSTGMPSTLSMAATFSRRDAEETGALIGRDARALGVDVILQPFINLYRDPTFERAYNTFGEDPVLTGALAAEFVRGAQAQNVMAQAKHFVAYDGGVDSQVDGQTLREVYVSPFVDVSQAGVASIMCAYNKINGIHACGNGPLQNGILRGEDGFRGFITSDWGAAHGAEFIAQGMDMEQPGTGPSAYFALGKEPDESVTTAEETAELLDIMATGVPEEQRFAVPKATDDAPPPLPGVSKNLGEALAKGTVSDADLDRAAARVLRQMERFGWLDRAPNHRVTAQPVAANARIVQRLAEDAAVLLKNDGVLPLRPADLASLVVIGPGALQTFAIVAGQEQSYGRAERQIGVWQALRTRAGGKGVRLAVADDMTGKPIPKRFFIHLTSTGARSQAVSPADEINHTRRSNQALPAGTRMQWDGTLTIPATGDYDIDLQLLGATGKFAIDGRRVGDMGWWGGHGDIVFPNRDNVVPTTDGLDNVRRLVNLSAGPHSIHVEATADGSGEPVQIRLAWVTPQMRERMFSAAVQAAKVSKVAVVFAWSRNRPFFELPGDQDRLIEAVAAVNPNTVVVLNTGQAVAMPWLHQVRAVLEMWYTGDEGGWAAADLLTGRANPAGRLPITWPQRLADGPANDPHHPERSSKGIDGKTVYGEGIHVGYRWLDHEKIEPLFAFGFGLSYTTFKYSDLTVAKSADGGLDVACRVQNTGTRAGDEVVQVYVGAPKPSPGGVEFAVRALVSFDRVTLEPGGSRQVQLHVPSERFRYWSLADGAWHDARAGRTVYVGASSHDLPLTAPITD